MFAIFPIIAGALATAFSFILKHPLVTKMLIFSFFLGIISSVISFFVNMVSPYLVTNQLFSIVSYFGVMDGLSIYLTIILSGFGVKQVLAFIRS